MSKNMPTKDRIIDVAGDIFGKKGYRTATIREIAKAAHANVAAVNYHFGDKENLYRAVLEDIFSKGFKKFPSVRPLDHPLDPHERLQFFIHNMFRRFLSKEGWGGYTGSGKLIAREFFDPTPAFESIVNTYINPHKKILITIISDLSPGQPGMETLLPCAISIIGQCVYYAFAAPVIRLIAAELPPVEENLEILADHVYRFSLGGIDRITKGGDGSVPDPLTRTKETLP